MCMAPRLAVADLGNPVNNYINLCAAFLFIKTRPLFVIVAINYIELNGCIMKEIITSLGVWIQRAYVVMSVATIDFVAQPPVLSLRRPHETCALQESHALPVELTTRVLQESLTLPIELLQHGDY